MTTTGRWVNDEDEDFEPQAFDPVDLIIVGVDLVGNIAGAIQRAANTTGVALKAFANHRRDKTEAFSDMLKDIEAL